MSSDVVLNRFYFRFEKNLLISDALDMIDHLDSIYIEPKEIGYEWIVKQNWEIGE